MARRIVKRNQLPVEDWIAQHIYRGRLMLGDNGLVFDVELNEWYDTDAWHPQIGFEQ